MSAPTQGASDRWRAHHVARHLGSNFPFLEDFVVLAGGIET
jgi:hypothetical protein